MGISNTHNTNIERSILASILFSPVLLHEAVEIVAADDFYFPFHRHVFDAMVRLDAKELPIDDEFLKKALGGKFDEEAILEIIATNPLPAIKPYLLEIRDKSAKRAFLALMNKTHTLINEDAPTQGIYSELTKEADAIIDRDMRQSLLGMSEFVDAFEKEMAEAVEKDGCTGYKTGITALDRRTGGFEAGELVVIAARPGMGKTAFATTIANHCDVHGVGVLFDSLEMDGRKIVRRLVAARANERLGDLRRGHCQNFTRTQEAKNALKKGNIILHSLYYPSIEQLCAKAVKVFRGNPSVKIWIIDHLKHIKKKSSASYEVSNEIAEHLKQIIKVCKEYGVVPVVLHQLNRGSEDRQNKRPFLVDLGQSSAIEELAGWVIFPHRVSYYEAKDTQTQEAEVVPAELIIGKARDGEVGTAHCFFCGMYSRFQNEPPVQVSYAKEEANITMGYEL